MAEQNLDEKTGARRVDEGPSTAHPVVIARSAFALGLVTGLFLKGTAKQLYELARGFKWHHDYERTVTYDENLPDKLGRREPSAEPGQPRYGGTGALGVSPESAGTAGSETTSGTRDV